MTQNELLYRAFTELVETLSEHRAIPALAGAVANARNADVVVVTRNLCRVEEDWVDAIERTLPYIAKAIGEDRQFIRSNGEILPIEKVRHISKESVQHLSRHSDLITREPKEDIIPDKLYSVERLSDYAVYENRFLYALLCRVRDFVAYRYEAVKRAYAVYRGVLTVKKSVTVGNRRISLEVDLTDEQDDLFAAAPEGDCASYLSRMEKITESVAFFLRTPLMAEVSRADKIKTKLTKTNVLRMDKNFKEAVSLYEFLLAYEKDGFVIEPVETRLDPVSDDAAREFAVPAVLEAFLVCKHGLGLEEELRAAYERELARRAEEAQRALAEEIEALKKRIEETGEGAERYMLLLEQRNAALERDSRLLAEARAEIEALEGEIAAGAAREEELKGEIGSLEETVGRMEEEKRLAEEEHGREMDALRAEGEEKLAEAETKHRESLAEAERAHREETGRIRAECETKVRESGARAAEREKETKKERAERAATERECAVLRARITALRSEKGLFTEADDFTTEAGFNALEAEFETLGRLVRAQWTDVKKMLRKEFYGDLRAAMRGKKQPEKSAEYEKLAAETKARRAREAARAEAPEEGREADENEEEMTQPDGAESGQESQED